MERRSGARSFVIGGLVGASAALAAVRRNRRRSQSPGGLAALLFVSRGTPGILTAACF